MDKIAILTVLVIGLFAYLEHKGTSFLGISNWDISGSLWGLFTGGGVGGVLMWLLIFVGIGVAWWFYTKDKTESVGVIITPILLIMAGLQDLIRTLISGGISFTADMCWADKLLPVKALSDLFSQSCPTLPVLIGSVLVGMIVAYQIYRFLQERI